MFYSPLNQKYCFKNPLHIKLNHTKKETTYFKYDLTYPIIYPFFEIHYEEIKKLNYIISQDIFSFKDSIKEQSKDYKAMYEKYKDDIKYQYEVYTDYEVTFNKNNILSIPIIYYEFTGGAHGLSTLISYNYDINKGKILQLSDIFKQDVHYVSILNKYIKEEIAKNPELYFSIDDIGFKTIDKNQEFYLTNEALVIYFGLYEIAPYSTGIPKFTLTYKDFGEYIRDRYKCIT